MVNADEKPQEVMLNRFTEKVLDEMNMKDSDKERVIRQLEQRFPSDSYFKRIYSQDERNTDNAWIETMAFHYHDDTGRYVGKFEFKPNPNANVGKVEWRTVDCDMRLFANHAALLKMVVDRKNAYWGNEEEPAPQPKPQGRQSVAVPDTASPASVRLESNASPSSAAAIPEEGIAPAPAPGVTFSTAAAAINAAVSDAASSDHGSTQRMRTFAQSVGPLHVGMLSRAPSQPLTSPPSETPIMLSPRVSVGTIQGGNRAAATKGEALSTESHV